MDSSKASGGVKKNSSAEWAEFMSAYEKGSLDYNYLNHIAEKVAIPRGEGPLEYFVRMLQMYESGDGLASGYYRGRVNEAGLTQAWPDFGGAPKTTVGQPPPGQEALIRRLLGGG